jgi:hypothetical protein
MKPAPAAVGGARVIRWSLIDKRLRQALQQAEFEYEGVSATWHVV